MSNTLKELRSTIRVRLTAAGIRVEDHIPEQIRPPMAMIAAGSPYLEAGDAYGTFTARFTVVLVASQATNEVATSELDEAVTAAVVALDGELWGIERVDQPTMLQTNNTQYLSTTIDVVTATSIDDGQEGG